MGTVRFASPLASNNVSESAGFLEHVVLLSEASTQTVTVTITGPSYRAGDMDISTQILTFMPGQTRATFRVAIIDDQLYEGDEVFGYEITGATNAQIDMSVENFADVRKLLGYILDNDQPTLPTVRFVAPLASNNVSEGAGFLEHVVRLSAPSAQAVTVTITGPAYRAGDMDVSTQTLTFAPGQTTATFRAAIVDDQIYEGDEVFGYEITGATNAQIDMSVENFADVRKLLGYIVDNDAPGLPTVRFAAPLASNNVSEGAGFLEHVVQLSAPSTQAVTVTITGPAYRVGDMDISTQTLTFAPGQTRATFRVSIVDDQIYEGDEVFAYEITGVTNARIDMSVENFADVRKLLGYILDNDSPASSQTVQKAVESLLRGASTGLTADLNAKVAAGTLTLSGAVAEVVKAATPTLSVATMAYEFFTGKIPSVIGIDFLVSPNGPNSANLNSAAYAHFNVVNRFINFAANLGKYGEAKDSFAAKYGSMTLAQATKDAYAIIFGGTPTDAKVAALLEGRVDFLASFTGDGPSGIGTKAAMVGFLLAAAATENVGVMARSNEAWMLDLADGSAPFAIDILDPARGYYKADFIFGG